MAGKAKNVQQRLEDNSDTEKKLGFVTLLTSCPRPPLQFGPAERQLWRETCEEMIKARTLTRAALVTVEQFTLLQVMARRALKKNEGTLAQRLAVLREARLAAEELGLSPSAHAKVKRPDNAVPDNPREMAAAELIDR